MQEGDVPRAGRTKGRGWDSEKLEVQGEGPYEAGTYPLRAAVLCAGGAGELRGGRPPAAQN